MALTQTAFGVLNQSQRLLIGAFAHDYDTTSLLSAATTVWSHQVTGFTGSCSRQCFCFF